MNGKSCVLCMCVNVCVHVCKLSVCVCGTIGCVLRKVSAYMCLYVLCICINMYVCVCV